MTGSAGGSGMSSSASVAASAASSPLARSACNSSSENPTTARSNPSRSEFAQFRGQHLLVPPGIQRKLVVRDDVSPPLRLAEVIQHDHRHLGQAQLAGSQQAAVAGDDPGVRIDQDRIR